MKLAPLGKKRIRKRFKLKIIKMDVTFVPSICSIGRDKNSRMVVEYDITVLYSSHFSVTCVCDLF